MIKFLRPRRVACLSFVLFAPFSALADSPTLSPDFPGDVAAFTSVYPNDVTFEMLADFAWKEFVALNYQGDTAHRGQAKDAATLDVSGPRVWETFWHRVEVFPSSGTVPHTGGQVDVTAQPVYNYSAGAIVLNDANYLSSSVGLKPNLWNNLDEDSELNIDEMYVNTYTDSSGTQGFTDENRILYQAKINEVGVNYLLQNNLTDASVRDAAKTATAMNLPTAGGSTCTAVDGHIVLPCGAHPSDAGYTEIKSAWRPLTPQEVTQGNYYTNEVIRYVGVMEDGAIKNKWTTDTYGLIGLHIIQKTKSFPTFTFATFEHVGNIGEGTMAQPSIGYIDQISQTGRGGNDTFGDKVVIKDRDNAIPAPVAAANTAWQAALQSSADGKVWANYQLTGIQAFPADMAKTPDLSKLITASSTEANTLDKSSYFLANIVIESNEELQNFTGIKAATGKDELNTWFNGTHTNMGGCMGCHGVAQSQGADFSFLVSNAPFGAPDVVGGTGNIVIRDINTYQDVVDMFNDYVADNPINIINAPHMAFWNDGYDNFKNGNAVGIKIVKCGDSAASNLIAILKGQDPTIPPHTASFNPQRMPKGGPYFPEAQIDNLANWIDRGCPETASSPQAVLFGDPVGIFSTTKPVRLDIGTLATKEDVPASHESWATQLVIKRLDGPNTGPVMTDHEIGIFSATKPVRLDIGTRAMKEDVPSSHRSWATVLEFRHLNGSKDGPVQYGDLVGLFSTTKPVRLDIGTRATKEDVPADHVSWATVLKVMPVAPMDAD